MKYVNIYVYIYHFSYGTGNLSYERLNNKNQAIFKSFYIGELKSLLDQK